MSVVKILGIVLCFPEASFFATKDAVVGNIYSGTCLRSSKKVA
jgi:hypothetical protein